MMTYVDPSPRYHLTRWLGAVPADRFAAATYGLVISSAVLVAAGGEHSMQTTVIEVASALLIYWLAELYSQVLGHRAAGERANRRRVTAAVRRGLSMMELSALPVLTLLIAKEAGASLAAASNAALGLTTLLLTLLGLLAGWRLEMGWGERLGSAALAGLAGVVMVALKITLHH